ncbi:hypothetical protein PC120_g12055 [Phytophthora cactorum]|nr:hypothetical protein PC120_g12055 [Phytophthora cactorum]
MLAPKRNVRAIVAFAKRWKPLVGRTTTPSSRGGKCSSGLQWRDGAQTSRTTKGQGAKSKIAFGHDLVTFMKDVRREEEYLCTGGMIEYMKMEQGAWIEMYLADKPSSERGLSALMRLCQRFAARHVLTIRSDGKKLPILFILRGVPGGTVETDELPTYPSGHVYTVQESSWMDATVWQTFPKQGRTSWQRRRQQLCVPFLLTAPRTAKEKRIAVVMRTIRAWENISTECVIKSFEKAIPKERVVMV